MAAILGKRKRRSAPKEADTTAGEAAQYQEALRRHFESAFEPVESLLPAAPSTNSTGAGEDLSDGNASRDTEDSDWEGLSEADNEVQVISYETTASIDHDENDLKSVRKRFMSSKPPTNDQMQPDKPKKSRDENSDLKSASSLTAEDIALQRLLSESHLLSGSTKSTLLPTLKARQAAQDLRLKTLGAKKSTNDIGAGNMPIAIRQGIETKKRLKEKNRRREAKESGIVLERKAGTVNKDKVRKRPRDVGAPAVGKWRGGTLVLGKNDVRQIEGQRLASDFGKKGKKGGKGRRR